MRVRSITQLTDALASGFTPTYLHFWGHQPRKDGKIGANCLSQWWPAQFYESNHLFATAEHYMMWRKAKAFGDENCAIDILAASNPRTAKELGRKVKHFDDSAWASQRFDIAVSGNLAKFSQNDELKAFLLSTRDKILVEASPTDKVWGIGLGAENPASDDPANWQGLNLLGFALMEVREVL